MDALIPIVVVPTVFGSGVWVVYLIVNAIRTRQQLRLSSEFHLRLLERMGSTRELSELLSSEGGQKLLHSLSVASRDTPFQRILRATQSGIVLVMLGVGIWAAVALAIRDSWPPGLGSGLFIVATIAIATGAGLLISARVSYALSKRMGLLDETQRNGAAGMMSAA